MSSAVVGAFLSDFLKVGLERAGSAIFQKVMRLRSVDKAMRAGQLTNPVVDTAVKDLEIIFGSYRGELDVLLSQFLNEVKRSGIITLMAEEAIVQTEHELTVERFVALYSNIVGQDDDKGRDLYKLIRIGLTSSLNALFKDNAMAFAVGAISKSLSAKLDRLGRPSEIELDGCVLVV